MEDVTDTVFRRIVAKCGKPDLFYTEFVSCDGLLSPGREKVAQRLQYTEEERPLIAQIWGTDPSAFYKAAQIIVELGFDGIDINMGCPVEKIVKQGACSALIENPTLAVEIIKATKEGAGDLPVSVKTRIGFKNRKTTEWASVLLGTDLAALTIHGRVAKEMSKYPADWDAVGEVVRLRDSMGVSTLIVGNGDIKSLSQALEMHQKYDVDGVMIGRGIFDNPWLFNQSVDISKVSVEEKLNILLEHVTLFDQVWGDKKNFAILKKFFKVYVNGFDGAADLRAKLMECEDADEVKVVISGM